MATKGSTGTYWERMYTQNGAGSPNTGTTAAGTATLLTHQSTTLPLPVLDAGWFQPDFGVNKSIRLYARGLISFVSAASLQTLTIGAYFASSDTTTAGTAMAITGTITPQASQAVSNAIWEFECDLNATAVGSAGTMQGLGLFTIAATAVTVGTVNGANPSIAVGVGGSATVSFNTEAAQYIQICSTWGASNSSASNTMTCYQMFVDACR